MQENSIIPADKGYRTKVIVIFVVVMLVALAIVQWGIPYFLTNVEQALDNQDEAGFMRYIRGLEIVMALMFLGFIPFCVYNIRMGLLARQEQRFPCSKMRVLRDTPLLTGSAAVVRGKLLVVMGIALMVVSVLAAGGAVAIIEVIVNGGAA